MFLDPLHVRLLDDLANDGRGEWELTAPMRYRAMTGDIHTIPAGFCTDFASVPRLPFVYALAGDTAHRPAVLHDYLCRAALVPRRQADDLFHEAMLAVGIQQWRADLMHLAVRSYSESLEG